MQLKHRIKEIIIISAWLIHKEYSPKLICHVQYSIVTEGCRRWYIPIYWYSLCFFYHKIHNTTLEWMRGHKNVMGEEYISFYYYLVVMASSNHPFRVRVCKKKIIIPHTIAASILTPEPVIVFVLSDCL